MFFKQLAIDKSLPFKIKVDGLMLDDRLIAFRYGVLFNKRHICCRIAHDDDFSQFGPGKIMWKEKLKECFEGDVSICDFGTGGYQKHKSDWTDNVVCVNRIIFTSNKLVVKLILYIYFLKEYAIKILRDNKSAIYIKKILLGRIKHYLSWDTYKKIYKSNLLIIKHRGLMGLIDNYIGRSINRFYTKRKYKIYSYRVDEGKLNKQNKDISVCKARLNDIDTISSYTGNKNQSIIQSFEKGHKCYFIYYKGSIVGVFWMKFNEIALQSLVLPIMPIERDSICIHDISIVSRKLDGKVYTDIIKYLSAMIYQENYKILYIVTDKNSRSLRKDLRGLGACEKYHVGVSRFMKKNNYKIKEI